MRKILFWGMVAVSAVSAGCKPPHVEEHPMTYWADPKNAEGEPCVALTAQAILKSGLPYPNLAPDPDASGSAGIHYKTRDVWVGPHRYVLPAKLVSSNGGYQELDPRRHWKVGGSLPNFWPIGEPGPVVDGMGPMVDITIQCSLSPNFVASYGGGFQSNEEGIAGVKKQYEKILTDFPQYPGRVTVSVREDLQMTEVLLERTPMNPQASYWPLWRELKGPDGSVSSIGCDMRHDPQKGYGGIGRRCRAGLSLSPESTVNIDIYVAHLKEMPSVFDQVQQLFLTSKAN